MTYKDFVDKWDTRFANNDTFDIGADDLREFKDDVVRVIQGDTPNVPAYVVGATYRVGDLVRYTPAGGQEGFYYALNAGLLTAPGPNNATDWKEFAKPVPATDLSQEITLVQAQGIDRTSVVAGRTYVIECPPNAQGDIQLVSVRGVSNEQFDVEGTLEVAGVRTAITDFNVQAGTWTVKQYSAGYTDVQARAAQLGRVAPAGTFPVITLTSEAPTDYGTFSSGTPTVDATGCAVGKVVRFAVGAGAAAPAFTKDPPAQPYKAFGTTYASGKAFSYSLLVCVDCIQVVIIAG